MASSIGGSGSGRYKECLMCCHPPEYDAITPCVHSRALCGACVMNLRRRQGHAASKHCPYCKAEWPVVIVQQHAASDLDFNEFDTNSLSRIDGVDVVAASEQVFEHFSQLLSVHCVICLQRSPSKDLRFPTLQKLQAHLKHAHGKCLCLVCAEHRNTFVKDLNLFTPKSLQRHYQDGTVNGKFLQLVEAHPMCKHCSTRCYNQDGLYHHLSRNHELCSFCERQSRRHRYFRDYNALLQHMREEHFVCEDAICLAETRVFFDNEISLNSHRRSRHADKLSRKERRELGTVQLDLVYRRSGAASDGRSTARTHRQLPQSQSPPRSQSPPILSESDFSHELGSAPSTSAAPFLGGAWSELRSSQSQQQRRQQQFPTLSEAHGSSPPPPRPPSAQRARPSARIAPVPPHSRWTASAASAAVSQPSASDNSIAGWAMVKPTKSKRSKKTKKKMMKVAQAEIGDDSTLAYDENTHMLQQLHDQRIDLIQQQRQRQEADGSNSVESLRRSVADASLVGEVRRGRTTALSRSSAPGPASHSGLPLPSPCPSRDWNRRNRAFNDSLRNLLQHKSELVEALQSAAKSYRSGSMRASEFYNRFLSVTGALNADTEPVLLEFIALLSDDVKRSALHMVYRASFETDTRVERSSSPASSAFVSLAEPAPEPVLEPKPKPEPEHRVLIGAARADAASPPVGVVSASAAGAPLPSQAAKAPVWGASGARSSGGSSLAVSASTSSVKPAVSWPALSPSTSTAAVQPTWMDHPAPPAAVQRTAPEPFVSASRPAPAPPQRPPPPDAFPSLSAAVTPSLSSLEATSKAQTAASSTPSPLRCWGALVGPLSEANAARLQLGSVAGRRLAFMLRLAQDCLTTLQERVRSDEALAVTEEMLRRPRSTARSLRVQELDLRIPLTNLGIEVRASEVLHSLVQAARDDYDMMRDWALRACELMSDASLYIVVDYVLHVYKNIEGSTLTRVSLQPDGTQQRQSIDSRQSRAQKKKKKNTSSKNYLVHFG